MSHGHEIWRSARELFADANGESGHILLRMTRAQRHEHMQPSAARRLRERGEAVLVKDRLQFAARADGVGEFAAARIEIEREPIRVMH